jgi:uncharacterized protein YndB with AHSA1/START domain
LDINFLDIEFELTINASPPRVFAALTAGVATWWGSPYFENENATKGLVLEPKIGGRFYERWDFTGEEQGSLLGTVVAIKHAEILRLEGPFGMTDGIIHGQVSFLLEPAKSGTLLKFRHKAAGKIDQELNLKYGMGWHDLLGRLQQLVEQGKPGGINLDPSLEQL